MCVIKAYYVVFSPEQTAWAVKAFHGFVFYCFLVYFQKHAELLIVMFEKKKIIKCKATTVRYLVQDTKLVLVMYKFHKFICLWNS